jgi:hypothetical protein
MSAPDTRVEGRDYAGREWEGRRDYYPPAPARRGRGLDWGLIGLGLIAGGLLAWHAFGPDLQRYLKIRNM